LKNNSPKQKRSPLLSLLRACSLLVCSFAFISCNRQSSQHAKNTDTKKPQAINNVKKDSYAAPEVISITAANQPKVVLAGKPIIRIDSSNGGAPFFTSYGTEQGLALSTVNCGIVDLTGNLWFGTEGGGISRYDGKSFANFTRAQGLAGNRVFCTIQDKSGDIWFGTYAAGASRYDGKRFTNYTTAQGLVSNQVWSMMQDKSGKQWFGTDRGVSVYDGKSFKSFSKEQGLAKNIVRSIFQDSKGNIWFGSIGGGVIKYDNRNFTTYDTAQGLAGMQVRQIVEDKSGNIWFATDRGASKYDSKNFSNYSTAKGIVANNVTCIVQDTSGRMWFGTDGGVSRYDSSGFTNYTTAQGLTGNGINCILQDKSGDIWFGISGSGINRYVGNSITYYTASQGLVDNGVRAIMEDTSGNIWFGTFGGGASKYDGKSFTNYTTAQGLPDNTVRCIMQDKAGNIWLGGNQVTMYDGKSFTTFTTSQGLVGNGVWCIEQFKSGDIWIGTNEGASKYDGKSFTNYTTAQGLPANFVLSIIQDKSGDIWFSTYGGGVSRYDGKIFTNYNTTQELSNNVIRSIIQDKFGDIWFGTDGAGVSKFDSSGFTNFSAAQGLADNVVYAIAEDSIRNIVWVGTNLGLSGLRIGTLANKNVFGIFNKNTGYPIKDVNTTALHVDNKGIIWAGCGDDKLIRFDFGATKKSSIPLNLVIQNVKVNNENICWNNLLSNQQGGQPTDSLAMINEIVTTYGKALSDADLDSMRIKFKGIKFDSIARFYPVPINLVLPYKDNNISIDFAAIEPDLPKLVRYQYKLEGYNKDWSPQSNGTTAVFGYIPEGSYTFKLKALSPYGIWSETQYKFKVLPPWYRTWWAYALYVCLFVISIWAFINYRSRKLSRENRLLEEQVAHRTHQLKQSLEELKSTQAQLIQQEKMASLGELTAGIAHEIQNPLNFVNNFSEVNTELVDELKTELATGNQQQAIEIADDIKDNEQKILHHGKRADAIVKGMLQHSRVSTGQKELTDINALADEYLRLSYHGMRAKDKTFNATLQTDFDKSIEKINVVPQDIGRVLLNLFNNAFYALSVKTLATADGNYEPTVSVCTKKVDGKIEIHVKDNGIGIPQKVVDKIFQPFFTTKPTGQGTGLGLSLSYDTIKAHGGEIKVETKEGEGSEFIIQLPLK